MSPIFSEIDSRTLASRGAGHTVREILGQPDLWSATFAKLESERPMLRPFLEEALASRDREVILTGAGSSSFIGEILEGPLTRRLGRRVQAVPTTDIVTHPRDGLVPTAPTLLISFARSGNSPESVAALERADAVLPDVRHLIITCNPEGRLAKYPTRNPRALFLLPPAADDQGLAMTGSFTAMALAGLLLGELTDLERARPRVLSLVQAGQALLAQGDVFRRVGGADFRRAVFLGSGPLRGAAKECHLKVLELTSGAVSARADSFLGFRHGPKAILDHHTLLVFLFSGSEAVRAYEEDLLAEIDRGQHGLLRLGVGGAKGSPKMDASLPLDGSDDDLRAICAVLTGQILGVYRSLSLGLRPDSPSASGAISRVVQGVTIHPFS